MKVLPTFYIDTSTMLAAFVKSDDSNLWSHKKSVVFFYPEQ